MKSRKDTYVLYNLFCTGGGIWGANQFTAMAFIEELFQVPITSLFDVFSGASIGGLSISAANIPDKNDPRKQAYPMAFATKALYASALALLNSNDQIILRQLANRASKLLIHRNIVNGHLKQIVLETMLAPHYRDTTISQTIRPVYIHAHDMAAKAGKWFGRGDRMLDTSKLGAPLNNGHTRLLSAAMASSSIHSVLEMYYEAESGHHYTDMAPYITPESIHRAFGRMARSAQKKLRSSSGLGKYMPLWLERAIHQAAYIRHSPFTSGLNVTFNDYSDFEPGRTFGLAKDVMVRTIAFEAADDVLQRHFDPAKHSSGDVFDFFTNFIANDRYGPYQASFNQVKQTGMQDLAADFDDESMAITGSPACTYITANIIPSTPEQARDFPSANYADADPDNFLKVYQFAKNEYVLKNLTTILGVVEEIADEKRLRGEISKAEHARLVGIARSTTHDKAAAVLDTVIVTKENAAQVLKEFGLVRKGHKIMLDAALERGALGVKSNLVIS